MNRVGNWNHACLATVELSGCCAATLEVGLHDEATVVGHLSLSEVAAGGRLCLESTIEYSSPTLVDYERLVMRFPNVRFAAAMDHDYRWASLAVAPCVVDEWTPHCAHIVLSDGSHVEFDGGDRSRLWVARQRSGHVEIVYYFSCGDAQRFFHFVSRRRVFVDNGNRPAGAKSASKIPFRHSVRQHNPLGWTRARLPYGYRAGIVFTDHADYDQPDPLRAVFFGHSAAGARNAQAGFVGEGLTATKSIFVRSHPGYSAVGLENEKFRWLVDELADAGIEIAAHLTRTTPTSREELSSDLRILRRYGVTTWIDHHFTLPQAVTGLGWKPESPYYCLDLLEDAGIEFLWSYWDLASNPPGGTLNLYRSDRITGWSHLAFAFGLAMSGEGRRTLPERGYHLLEGLTAGWGNDWRLRLRGVIDEGRLLGEGRVSGIGGLIVETRDLGRAIIRGLSGLIARRSGEGQTRNPVFYEHDVLRQPRSGRGFTLFTSIRINDLARAYAPSSIDRLIRERGVHIGHLYLGCETHPLRSGRAFRAAEGEHGYVIARNFADHLQYIAQRCRDGDLWCATLRELGHYYAVSRQVSVEVESRYCVRVTNHSDQVVRGFCVLATRAVEPVIPLPSEGRNWDYKRGSNAFWADLGPGEVAYLRVVPGGVNAARQ